MQILARSLCICCFAANTFFTRCKYQSKLYIVLVSCVFAKVWVSSQSKRMLFYSVCGCALVVQWIEWRFPKP